MTTDTFWTFARLSYWTLAVALALSVASVWLCLINVSRHSSNRRYAALELFRLVIVGLVIVTLFQPEHVSVSERLLEPVVAVLCDESHSMTTRDVMMPGAEKAVSRSSWLDSQRRAEFWGDLEKKYKVAVTGFSPSASANAASNTAGVTSADRPETRAAVSEEDGTDINAALEKVSATHDDLRAVLLLSDGDWNMGKPPVSAATKLAYRNVPVFTVAVGSDKHLPDLELQSVSAPAYGLMDEHISLPFVVQSRLSRDVRTTVSLHGPRGPEGSKDIVIPANDRYHGSIFIVPKIAGDFSFTLDLPVEKDEVFDENNSKSFRMAIRREILKVLLVESQPRWEYRFLHNALSRDPGVVVRCLLFHPGMAVGGGKDYLSAFPQTKEEISQYDVVFLGDVGLGSGELTEQNVELLKGLVEQQGSGLVFLPGGRGRQASFLSTPLKDMMPVVLDESQTGGFGFGVESKLSLTARGRDHLLTMLASDSTGNYGVWKRLPGFYWYAGVLRARLGSDVLAVHSIARNAHGRIPLLVTRDYGSGKTLFMGTDSAWRWRRGVEDVYHYRFWGQVVRWMAHQRHLAQDVGIRFFYSPESPKRGTSVFLHATVFDKSGYPLESGTVRATIESESGRKEHMELTAESGGWGVFGGSFVPQEGGRHAITIKCAKAGREVRTSINVSSPRREQAGRPARGAVLREISRITGGKSGSASALNEVISKLNLLAASKPEQKRFRLWCHPLWAGLIVGLLGVYWTARKLIGML